LKALKPWQIIVLVVVVLGIAGGAYGIYSWVTSPDTSALPANTQLYQVQYGNIVNSVSVSGSVVFPEKEELAFGSAGTVSEVDVQEGAAVVAGQALAKLDSTSTIALEEAVVQAKINLRDAEDNRSATIQAELDMANAKVALKTAQDAYEKAQNPYTESDIAQAELGVVNAKIALKAAQDAYDRSKDRYVGNPTVPEWILDYEQKTWQLAAAEANLTEAETNLTEMQAGADPLQVEQKQKQLALAETNLALAEQNLTELQGDGSLEAELQKLEIASAQAALDEALANLEMATMVAPFAGTVTSVNIDAGQTVNASTVAIELVSPSVAQVSAILDEIDVAQVKVGQRATVSLDALPDVELSGEVSTISSVAKTQSGVVSYPITIQMTLPSGVQLMEGMSATADVVVQEASNVLIIPNQAIGGSTDNPTVKVMVNGVTQEKAVKLGLSDGLWSEVTEGLQEGDIVVVEMATTTSSTTTPQSNTRGFQMMPGASFSGGGEIFIR